MANNTENETYLLEECSKRRMFFSYIFGIIGFVCAVFGILGNVTSVIVLVQPSMSSSTSILLVTLAAYDTLLLTSLLLSNVYIFLSIYGFSDYFNLIESIIYSCVVHFALIGIIYTTVMVTIERAVVVVFPLKAKLVCTKTRTSVACVAVFVWSLIYTVPMFILSSQIIITNTSMHYYTEGNFFKYVYWLYLNTVFQFVLPVGVIIILNIAIIQRLCTSGRRIIHQVSSRGDNQTQLTVMIIVLTWIFCASRLMFMTVIYHREQEQHEMINRTDEKRTFDCPPASYFIRKAREISMLLNSATNFIVYSIFGHKFRHCLHKLCCSRHSLQAHRSPPETQAPSGNTSSTSASSLHLNFLKGRQRSYFPSRTTALLAVPETGC